METLNNAKVGNFVEVQDIFAQGLLRERMLALGVTKGTNIEVIRRGPSGDPTVYDIRGAMIALRKEEASLIMIS
ncbi:MULTISPECIES: FeoA family protein [unclassified Clostridium]|uniref:FeoA family protein n=1 Tax=unclassified Clostridium TaxID=2614128 RepID=UPI00052C7281|nr:MULTISPECIES: FeoA family protein [unclassified Clostridium]KGK88807.1 iron transporter FeoA [Clostridium sp. HMP27]MBE6066503.1 ferrous iron transport protein A [Clostridium lundense]